MRDTSRISTLGLVSVMDAEAAPTLGQLTKAEGAKVAALKRGIKRAWWNPFAKAAFRRQIARIEILARKRESLKEKEAAVAAKIAAEPKIALGPVSPEAAKDLPWGDIRRKAKAKARDLVVRKEGTLRALAAEAKTVGAREKFARTSGQSEAARQLKMRRRMLEKQIIKVRTAKVRPENIVREETEKARVRQAIGRGAAGVAQYGQRRFQEGKATAAGVFTQEIGREFLGPYRVQ